MNYQSLSVSLFRGLATITVLLGVFFFAQVAHADVEVTMEPVSFFNNGEQFIIFQSVAVDIGSGPFRVAFEVAKDQQDIINGTPEYVALPSYTVGQGITLSYMFSHTLDENTTYYVRARGTDGVGSCEYSNNGIQSFVTPGSSVSVGAATVAIPVWDGTGICPGSTPASSGSGISSSGGGHRRINNASTNWKTVAISARNPIAYKARTTTPIRFAEAENEGEVAVAIATDTVFTIVEQEEIVEQGEGMGGLGGEEIAPEDNILVTTGIEQTNTGSSILAQRSVRELRVSAEATGSGMLLRGEYDVDASCPLSATFEIYRHGQFVRTVGPFTSIYGGSGEFVHEVQGLAPGQGYTTQFIVEQCGERTLDDAESVVAFVVPVPITGGGALFAHNRSNSTLVEITGENSDIAVDEGYDAAVEARNLLADSSAAQTQQGKSLPWILGIIAVILAVWIGRLRGRNVAKADISDTTPGA